MLGLPSTHFFGAKKDGNSLASTSALSLVAAPGPVRAESLALLTRAFALWPPGPATRAAFTRGIISPFECRRY
jgi:hypothetical protein